MSTGTGVSNMTVADYFVQNNIRNYMNYIIPINNFRNNYQFEDNLSDITNMSDELVNLSQEQVNLTQSTELEQIQVAVNNSLHNYSSGDCCCPLCKIDMNPFKDHIIFQEKCPDACPFCLINDFSKYRAAVCCQGSYGHKFHPECLAEWYSIHKNKFIDNNQSGAFIFEPKENNVAIFIFDSNKKSVMNIYELLNKANLEIENILKTNKHLKDELEKKIYSLETYKHNNNIFKTNIQKLEDLLFDKTRELNILKNQINKIQEENQLVKLSIQKYDLIIESSQKKRREMISIIAKQNSWFIQFSKKLKEMINDKDILKIIPDSIPQ